MRIAALSWTAFLALVIAQPAISNTAAQPGKSITYVNKKYRFSFSLPITWRGYSVTEGIWEGFEEKEGSGDVVVERGPQIRIINPQSTKAKPYQDIYIMVFSLAQWDLLQRGKFFVSAAGVGPGEIGRSHKYVFAEPPRMINDSAYGYEEVVKIIHSNPLHAF